MKYGTHFKNSYLMLLHKIKLQLMISYVLEMNIEWQSIFKHPS